MNQPFRMRTLIARMDRTKVASSVCPRPGMTAIENAR